MNKFTKILLILIIQINISFLCANSLFSQTLSEKLDNLMEEYNRKDVFNGSVLIADSSGILLEKGYGFANFDENKKNTAQTQFRIGSITKQFTATVIMQLVQEGKIGLNDPISKYIPEYRKDTGDSVTIHQLLNHTSGIFNYTDAPGWVRDSSGFRFTKEHMLMYALAGDLLFTPGSAYSYTNTGYFLLGIIAERVTGTPYELLLRQRIFEPAGMNSSGVEREEFPPPNLAQGYIRRGLNYVKEEFFYMPNALGAGDIYSTVGDLYRWDRALNTNDFLNQVSKERMWTPYLENYGYGWVIANANGSDAKDSSTVIMHGGSIAGFEAFFARFVDEDITVILLTNTGSVNLNNITGNIYRVLHGVQPDKIKKPFLPELERLLVEKGNEQTVKYFKDNIDSIKMEYVLDEGAINLAGYQALIEEINTEKAIAIFQVNIEAFPESFNVYDSMAEAFMKKGENNKAIEFYKKSLSVNPGNKNAIEMLRKLGEKTESSKELKLKNEDLLKFVGTYQLNPNFFIEISVFEDRIFEQATGQSKYEIFPITEIDFELKVVDAKIKFLVSGTGMVKGLTLFQNNQSLVGDKID